jgi:hypothetical protein
MSVIDNVPLADQIAEVKREITQRGRVYIRMIDQNKLTKEEAQRRMLAMAAVLQTLERIRGGPPLPHHPTVDSETTLGT